MNLQKLKRYYTCGAVVQFEEDMYNEFKGHRNLSVEELPPWTQENKNERASRRAVSRSLNAFLNTGKGGTVYLGILDSGVVRGIKMTQFQMDHVVGGLDDLMQRYSPPVTKHRYRVKFVPVFPEDTTEEQRQKRCQKESVDNVDIKDRLRPHQYRSHNFCWCDKDSIAQFNCGLIATDYVVEIKIKPWDPNDVRNQDVACGSLAKVHPYHEDEEGNVYFRRQASLIKSTWPGWYFNNARTTDGDHDIFIEGLGVYNFEKPKDFFYILGSFPIQMYI
ncbi:hypothetical protein FSP39_003502 [Pinctada imbricata]|uniref:Schlafen AlbA-2 domain-containing protein n=1 Tax=Pinctada imbricata TaxID=66713 RepID=A0AA88XQ88_PINIB|nr:hypothetical protein FSP39_003502 [Pinctada imbricata]